MSCWKRSSGDGADGARELQGGQGRARRGRRRQQRLDTAFNGFSKRHAPTDGVRPSACPQDHSSHFRDELGLTAGSRLRAELHSLLVYGKGQFFLPHQDSEKHDEMVATLVVSRPSVHSGGELVVDDGGTERTYRGSRDDRVLVAFYADRRHEVRPVRSGYRVTLTFNVMIADPTPTRDASPVEQAAHRLSEHFTSPATSRYGGRDLGEPTRLVFLLDHEYSQKGLGAKRFKGADGKRVRLLQAAAERAGCETVLGIAEIKETWNAIPAGESGGTAGTTTRQPSAGGSLRAARARRR